MSNQANIECAELPRAEQIARLNDQLRKSGTGGKIMITKAVSHLTGFRPDVLMAALANYQGFDTDNDPHGERDFGDLTLLGTDLLFKIDYYDAAMEFGSDDPADATRTTRVLTVMCKSDW